MKKLIFAVAALLPLFVSCTVEERSTIESPTLTKVILNGNTGSGTRISIGELSGMFYPVLWSKGDKIGVLSTEKTDGELLFNNTQASLNGEGGTQLGAFTLEKDVTVSGTESIYIYYPYSSGCPLVEDGGVMTITGYVPLEQKASRPGDSSNLSNYAISWASTTVSATPGTGGAVVQNTEPFTLRHELAYVRLAITGSAYSTLKLSGASIWADGAELAGDITVNLENGSSYSEKARDYVVLSVDNPEDLGSGKDLWLVTLPCDLSGKDVYVTVAFKDGETNVTIPVKVNSGKLKANAVNTINVNVTGNTISWYEPRESRTLAGGWCYGDSNCIMITDMSAPIEIDVKAHGFFCGAREPKYVWASNLAYNNPQPSLKISGTTIVTVPSDATLTVEDCGTISNGKFTLDFTGTDLSVMQQAGKLIIADAELHTVWAFTLWYVGDYKDGVISGRYRCGKEVMDRNIGAAKEAFTANRDGYGVQFQWGRPFCFGWSGAGAYKISTTVCYSLQGSANYAEHFLKGDGVSGNWGDWWLGDYRKKQIEDRKQDLWGNPTGIESAYDKTIFDPCPKGWTVASPDAYGEATRTPNFVRNEYGVYMQKYQYGDNETDVHYYRNDGYKTTAGGNTANNYAITCSYWSNAPCFASSARRPEYGWSFTVTGSEVSPGEYSFGSFGFPCNRSYGFSVRCMKDEKGR